MTTGGAKKNTSPLRPAVAPRHVCRNVACSESRKPDWSYVTARTVKLPVDVLQPRPAPAIEMYGLLPTRLLVAPAYVPTWRRPPFGAPSWTSQVSTEMSVPTPHTWRKVAVDCMYE